MAEVSRRMVLVADKDKATAESLRKHCEKWGYDATCVADLSQLTLALRPGSGQVLILGWGPCWCEAKRAIGDLLKHCPDLGVIVMAAQGSIQDAVQAIKEGVLDYLPRPIDLACLRETLENIPFVNSAAGRMVLSASLSPTAFSSTRSQPTDDMTAMERLQKQAIEQALLQSDGHVAKAGAVLGISQATMYRKMKRFGIPLPRSRKAS